MKNLLIMRHAKSAYPADVADDFDRPLNKRGRKDVPHMADLLRSFGPTPECILSSPAARARETAEGMVSGLGAAAETLLFDERLYLADPETLTQVTGELPDSYGTILAIAHNPGLEQWVARLPSRISRYFLLSMLFPDKLNNGIPTFSVLRCVQGAQKTSSTHL